MFFKGHRFKYMLGVFLFIFVIVSGFIKINVVYSSTGIVTDVKEVQQNNSLQDDMNIATINDKAFISIYEEGYGYDIILRFDDKERVFSLKFPWRQ